MAFKIADIQNWRTNFMTKSVQNNSKTFGSDFLSSESTVLFSGPAEFTDTQSELVPIGLVQNVQVAQQRQIQQLFEVGSRKPFFVPGRTIVSGGIARILFDGPSLMYSMYMRGEGAGIKSTDGSYSVLLNPKDSTAGWKPIAQMDVQDKPTIMQTGVNSIGGSTEAFLKNGSDDTLPKPGYFFINLASSYFNKPTGLGFVLYDMEGEPYGGFYMENCYIQAHTFSVASQQTVLVENVSFRASSIAPIEL